MVEPQAVKNVAQVIAVSEATRTLLEPGTALAIASRPIAWSPETARKAIQNANERFASVRGDQPAEWIIAQLDYREEDVRFGAHQENQMWAQWAYDNGVHAVLSTGARTEVVGAAFVLRGSEGTIRIDADDGPMLELEQAGDRTPVDVDGEGIHRGLDLGDPDDRNWLSTRPPLAARIARLRERDGLEAGSDEHHG